MRKSLLSLACLVTCALSTQGADWPCFRGPDRDGIARAERGINKAWNQRVPQTLWKIPLSDDGFAAPAIANGRLYIADHEGKEDIVRALDAATGKELWRFAYPDAESNRFGFTVSTPLVLDNKVYVSSRKGKIHCLDAATGEKLWARDLRVEYSATPPIWEYCMSPVVDNQALILGVSAASVGLAALDKDTGKNLWETGSLNVSYASPVVATLYGRKQYLVLGADALFSLDPATGKVLWQVPWPTIYRGKKGPTPVLVGDRIFVATTEGGDTGLVDPADGNPVVVWKGTEMQDHFTTPIYYHDRIYGSSDPKFLICVDPSDGKILWKQESGQFVSVIGIDDTVIALSGDKGELIMADATTPEYRELGRFTPLGGKSYAAPIIADGRLYVRNQKELACIDLK